MEMWSVVALSRLSWGKTPGIMPIAARTEGSGRIPSNMVSAIMTMPACLSSPISNLMYSIVGSRYSPPRYRPVFDLGVRLISKRSLFAVIADAR